MPRGIRMQEFRERRLVGTTSGKYGNDAGSLLRRREMWVSRNAARIVVASKNTLPENFSRGAWRASRYSRLHAVSHGG